MLLISDEDKGVVWKICRFHPCSVGSILSLTRWKLRYTNTFDKLITKQSCISMHWLKISYQGLDAGVINT